MAHKLNRHEANVADILQTLRDVMDNKVVAVPIQRTTVVRPVFVALRGKS